jgi:eukaryotic-like serine/threonine-protein kinase
MSPGAMIGGKYRLLRRLGRGAMGEVWAAVNEDTEREVALKLITTPDPELRRRLKREGRAIGRLEHPHIVQILDMGETASGEPFLVMQRLSGETLEVRLRREGVLPPPVAAAIALDVARALRAAHDKQIVHRDLKPANIFLHREPDTDEDVVKVVDFGVSKMTVDHEGGGTVTGGLIGSPAYMSPEQIRSVGVDGRTDVWSLGVMLFEMLSGSRPFPGQQSVVVLGQILSMPVPRVETLAPHVDAGLGDVIADCLERDPERRVATAAELTQRLRAFAPRGRFATVEEPGARERFASYAEISPLADPGAEATALEASPRRVSGTMPAVRLPAPEPPPRRVSGTMPAVRAPAPAPAPREDRELEVPTAVFQPSALLGAIAGAAEARGARDGDGEAATYVFRPSAALRIAAAKADEAPPTLAEPPTEAPSVDESVQTNEIDQTLPRALAPAAPSSPSWPRVEAPAFSPSSGSWSRPEEAPAASAAPPAAAVPAGPEPPPPAAADVDVDIDAPTGQMPPENRRKYRITQPLDPALVPRSPAARFALTQPIAPGFRPPSPAANAVGWNVAPGAAVTTTTSPTAATPPPSPPAPQEWPFGVVPPPPRAPRWHTALLVLSAVALIVAVAMLALTLGGDGSVASAPEAGSALPAASASASAAPAPR